MKITSICLLTLLLPAAVHGQALFGVTATDLVTINTTTGVTTTVGSLGLPANAIPQALAWHTEYSTLYGIAYQYSGASVSDQFLFRVDPATGAATKFLDLGPQTGGFVYKAIDFNPQDQYMYLTRESSGSPSTQLAVITFAGNVSGDVILHPYLHIDSMAYDLTHSSFLAFNSSQGGTTYFVSPAGTDGPRGPAPSGTIGDLAYSDFSNRFYALDSAPGNHNLYVLNAHQPLGPTTLESTIHLDTDQVQGIAFQNVPEPSEWAAVAGLGLAGWALARRRR
ncbi:MAG TPA: PEP-CTERM sorting domain-containing protein [Candidatus Limnocylindria bacterium]|jgi:hypothetical protein|nr:PEP-CTERM sorting domain-containing protein [Candidatus Limnocylindria bacterium]